MEVQIDQIPQEGLHLSYEMDPLLLEMGRSAPFKFLSLVQVNLDLLRIEQDGVYVEGLVSAKISSECSRCLASFSSLVEATFHLECRPQSSSCLEGEYLLPREELDVHYYSEDKFDLDPEVLGQLFLSAPMNPLCGPDCRGLCPECGKNLNHALCRCQVEDTDIRWTGLQHFVHKESHAESKT